MPTMNNTALIKIMNILEISTTKLANELYISQSLVSKWRSGSRTLKAGSSQYMQLMDYFIKVNKAYEVNILENFFDIDNTNDNYKLKQYLNKYLLSYPYKTQPIKDTFFEENNGDKLAFKSYRGEKARIDIQNKFWKYVATLDPKPDIYIKEINYGLWSLDPIKWLDTHHEHCLEYMNSGGKIYYFSDLNIINKRDYYTSWEFSSHRNLHPTYHKTILSEKTGWSYFIAKDYLSISYFTPEDNPNDYYTAVHQDKATVEAHYKYIKTQYDKNNRPIIIDTNDKFNFAIQMCQLYKDDINPIFYIGKFIPYIFSDKKSFKTLLIKNNVPKNRIKSCIEIYDFVNKEILSNTKLTKQFFIYKEDLNEGLSKEDLIDTELSGMTNKPIYLTNAYKEELVSRLNYAVANNLYPHMKFHIISKSNKYVYNCFKEINSNIFVKYNKWCYTFNHNIDHAVEIKIIQDPTACSIRYEMFDEILKKE